MVIIEESEQYILLHNKQQCWLVLIRKISPDVQTLIAEADFFFYPEADRTALLSNFILYEQLPEAIHFMMLSIERWMEGYHARFFSLIPNENIKLFLHQDITCKSDPDSFIMLQSQNSLSMTNLSFIPDKIPGLEVVVGDTFETKALFFRERDQFCHLLQQTYWGKTYNSDITEHRIRSAATVLGLKYHDQYIGFLRFLSNGSLGFISDMVIDEQYRGKGYSNFLFKQLTQLPIYRVVQHTLLTIPLDGAGKEYAPKVYSHFGFKKCVDKLNLTSNGCILLYLWIKPKMEQLYK